MKTYALGLTILALSSVTLAADFGATLGASYEYGQLGDSGMGLDQRSMTGIAVDVLPAYRINSKWLVGPDFSYRWQQQQTTLSNSGGTNLAGNGWLLGLGANYRLLPQLDLQGAINFVGNYKFQKQTDQSEDDQLQGLIGASLKAQYFFFQDIPLSFDLMANFQNWSTFRLTSVDRSNAATQWMVGVGLTYFFGEAMAPSQLGASTAVAQRAAEPVREERAAVTTDVATTGAIESAAAAQGLKTEKTETGTKINLESGAFASGKADLSSDYKAKLIEIAKAMNVGNKKIAIEGYTDSSGRAKSNEALSQRRADAVKAALIEGGLKAEQISAIGMGAKNPIADNKNPDGRAKNRRVEIKIEN